MPESKIKPLAKTVVKTGEGHKIIRSITINRPVDELYRFWRNLENLPRVMRHLESVTQVSHVESHWVAKAPAGHRVEWDAIIFNEHPNELIAWRSREGSEVPNAGSVRFAPAPGGLGTEITVSLEYTLPASFLGEMVAKFSGENPERQLAEDLAQFKMLMESGEGSHT